MDVVFLAVLTTSRRRESERKTAHRVCSERPSQFLKENGRGEMDRGTRTPMP